MNVILLVIVGLGTPRSPNSRTDSHHRGPHFDCDVIIVYHTHREFLQRDDTDRLAREAQRQLMQTTEVGTSLSGSLVGGGIAMSPFAATWGKVPKLGIAPSCSSGRNPASVASPSRFTSNRMLKKSASFVLASFRPSTGTRPPHHSAARTDLVLLIRRTMRPRGYAWLPTRRGAHSPPAVRIAESHAGSARTRTEYSHRLNHRLSIYLA